MVTLTPVTVCRTVLVMRAGPAHREYGDPYEVAATCVLDGSVAYVLGCSGQFRHAFLAEGALKLRARYGVRVIEWERIRGRRVDRVSIDLTKRVK